MIYITGNTHSDFSRFTEENFQIQSEMTKDDYIIICGDFGGVWTFEEESSREKELLDWLGNKNFTTLFVDGNHENYTRLYNYPIEEKNNERIYELYREKANIIKPQDIIDLREKYDISQRELTAILGFGKMTKDMGIDLGNISLYKRTRNSC